MGSVSLIKAKDIDELARKERLEYFESGGQTKQLMIGHTTRLKAILTTCRNGTMSHGLNNS